MLHAIRAEISRAVLLLAMMLGLAACNEPKTGPVEIRYGRDTCELCNMIISDPRYATQIRGGPGHEAHKFDDIGDALLFLERQTWKDDPNVEFWVMDVEKGKTWLDARKASYLGGMQSPMAHGYGALAEPRPGTVGFDTMKALAKKRAAKLYCLPGSDGATSQ